MPRQRVALSPGLTRLLRESRTRLRISQAQAADLAGVSETWWRRIEGGNKPKGDAEIQTVANMLHTLGVEPAELAAIGEQALAIQLGRIMQNSPGDKRALAALLEGLSSEESAAVVAFISTLRRISDDRRRITERGA